MKALLFDLACTQPMGGTTYHGGAEYGKRVFERLLALNTRDVPIAAFYDPNRPLEADLEKRMASHGVTPRPCPDLAALQRLLSSGDVRRVYSSWPTFYFDLDFHRVEYFITLHGLRDVETPWDAYEPRYDRRPEALFRYAVRRYMTGRFRQRRLDRLRKILETPCRKRFIAVPSEHSKYSLLDHYPALSPADIHVAYSPRRPARDGGAADRVLADLRLAGRGYFLIVSANRWIKNAARALEALGGLYAAHPALAQDTLVLGLPPTARLARAYARQSRMRFLDYVDESTLECLYREAYALLFPSLNEGFGYPPLECMRHGTPVLSSATSAMTEMLGDAPLYFDPLNILEMRNRIFQLANDPACYAEHARRGPLRYERVARKQDEDLDYLCRALLNFD